MLALIVGFVSLPKDSNSETWSETRRAAEVRTLEWIKLRAEQGAIVNWSTSLAGLGLLGQRHQNPGTLLLQFSEQTQSDKTQLISMAKYLVDSVVFGQMPETDTRALSYALEFFVLFSALGGPIDVAATQSLSLIHI